MGMVDMDIQVSRHLKEELAWAADKQLQVISTMMLLKNSFSTTELIEIKEKAILNLKQYCLHH